eukprot:7192224-Prymnesium_polylepis.1
MKRVTIGPAFTRWSHAGGRHVGSTCNMHTWRPGAPWGHRAGCAWRASQSRARRRCGFGRGS